MGNDNNISILLVDDHAIVRRGLISLLNNTPDFDVIGEATSGKDAIEFCKSNTPDIILLDLFLPDISGIQVAEHINKLNIKSKIILLTSHEGDEFLADATSAGITSYLLKDISPEDLVKTIRSSHKGETTLSPRLAKALLKQVAQSHNNKALHEELTKREREVLRTIAKGLSNADIAEELSIGEKTVKTHVSSILSKLYLSDRTQAAVYAWQNQLN